MKCAGCGHRFVTGDKLIKARPSEFMRDDDVEFDDLIADVLGGEDSQVAYCEECTHDSPHGWHQQTYEEDA